jgi:hypothetical protein
MHLAGRMWPAGRVFETPVIDRLWYPSRAEVFLENTTNNKNGQSTSNNEAAIYKESITLK